MPDRFDGLISTMRHQAEALAGTAASEAQRAHRWMSAALCVGLVAMYATGVLASGWLACRKEAGQLRVVSAPVELPVLANVGPMERFGPPQALQMPPTPRPEWVRATEGCPLDYVIMNGACWVEVKERPPCATSYLHDGKCWAPLYKGPRPGVSSPSE